MKVRTLKLFNDLQSKKLRKVGELFEVSQKRASELLASPHGLLIEVIEEETHKESGGGNARKNKTSIKNKNNRI